MTSAGVAEILLLAVIGCDAVLDDIGAGAVRTGDDFSNHALTLAHCSIIRVWHTTQEAFFGPGAREDWHNTVLRATGEPLDPAHFVETLR